MEKSSDKQIKKFSSKMQARLLLVFCIITLLMTGLIGRLIYIIQKDGDRYAKHVLSRQSYVSSVLPYKRGDIVDRNGTVLATSELQYRLILDPKNLLINSEYITSTLSALNKYFGVDESEVQKILDEKPQSQYVILLKDLKYDPVKEFKTLMEKSTDIKSVYFEEEYVREYPLDTLAGDLIGFTSADDTGFFGMEESYNDTLKGTNGREYGYYDSSLNIERIVKKPVNGDTIVSTIDANAQRIVQKHIKQFNTDFGSKGIGVLVMNPNTGEILAMASNQEWNPNDPRKLDGIVPPEELSSMTDEQKLEALNNLWKNDVISSSYEPGSTFKPFTISAALEEGLVTDKSTFFCDGGQDVSGTYIKCSSYSIGGHGEVTLGQALMKSCNDALMQIVAMEGKDIFYRYQKDFGFGKKTGIDLPGEGTGILADESKAGPVDLAVNSFGQSFNVTMMQMAAAFSSLVNGGNYYQPHIVKQIVNDTGATVKQMDPVLVRRSVSEATSEFIQNTMYQTVEEGTAKGAQVEGYAVGGKTATAQKHPLSSKTYIVSFMGEVPAVNPQIVIYVSIDEPQNVPKQADSSIATKLASRIMKELLPALGIYPEGDIDYLLTDENGSTSGNTTTGAAGNQTGNTAGGTVTGNNTGNNSANNENGSTGADTTASENNTAGQNNGQGSGSENGNTAQDGQDTAGGNGQNSGNTAANNGDTASDNTGTAANNTADPSQIVGDEEFDFIPDTAETQDLPNNQSDTANQPDNSTQTGQ